MNKLILIPIFFLFSCHFFKKHNERYVTKEIIRLVSNSKYNEVQYFIESELESGNMKSIYHDLKEVEGIIKMNKINLSELTIIINDSLNDPLGRLRTEVVLFNGIDSLTGLTSCNLYLYFGPYYLFSKNKVTGIELKEKFNTIFREELIKQKRIKSYNQKDINRNEDFNKMLNDSSILKALK